MKIKLTLITLLFLTITFVAKAQKGNNQFQIGGQANLPVGDLKDAAKTGYGVSARGLYGFGQAKQQVTLEAGYNRFSVKGLPSGADGNFSSIPIYTGYRYYIGNVTLEPQAGVSFNRIAASAGSVSASDSQTNFGWATSVGYMFSNLELSVRYQSSEVKNSDANLTFVGIRLAYSFAL